MGDANASAMKSLYTLFSLITIAMLIGGCKTTQGPASRIEAVTYTALTENTSTLQDPSLKPFYHGVASGDPYANSVVLWTRITPETRLPEVEVQWEVASDKNFSRIVSKGSFTTGPERDYTVKVVADGLNAGTDYYYRFMGLNATSNTGHTRTAPDQVEVMKLGIVSCSNVEFGYFNVYGALAEDDIDVILHLGDYIYEYGADGYGDKNFARKNIPGHEIVSLQDYRDRYSQYRLDPDLRDAHAAHAFIAIWDDHEITNNSYVDGAQNHQEDEGDYQTRKEIARQVYYEWIPIREDVPHYRKFDFGNLLDLYMLDERLAARTVQPDSLNDPQRSSPVHKLLGDEQMQWLQEGIKGSEAAWKVIGNQVMFSYTDWAYPTFERNLDAWDGYPGDQAELNEFLKTEGDGEVVFVTGDTHRAWAFEATNDPLNAYKPETGEGAVAVEFGVTSITSGNANERFPDNMVIEHENKMMGTTVNPHLKYVNMRDHGYLKLSLYPESLKAEFKVVPTLKERTRETQVDKVFTVKKGSTRLIGN